MSPSLQLDLENALRDFFIAQVFSVPASRPVHAAHAVESEPEGTFLIVVAEPPDWETMIINAIVPVRFEFATVVKDPATRAAATMQHQNDVGSVINLLADQNFAGTLFTLNSQASTLGFTGWEAQKTEADGTTDTQIVTRLAYEFEVFLPS